MAFLGTSLLPGVNAWAKPRAIGPQEPTGPVVGVGANFVPLQEPAICRAPPGKETRRCEARRERNEAFKECERDKASTRVACEERAERRYANTLYRIQHPSSPKEPGWLCRAADSGCATLSVHVYGEGGTKEIKGERPPRYPENNPLLIARLGSGPRCAVERPRCWGKVLSTTTTEERKVRLAPGHYGIAALESTRPGAHVYTGKEVTVTAGQALDVTLIISLK